MANLRLLFVKELTLCKKLQGKDWRALLAEQWIERMETVWFRKRGAEMRNILDYLTFENLSCWAICFQN